MRIKKPAPFQVLVFLEATPRFELGNKGFADLCLTTWLCRQNAGTDPANPYLARVEGFEPSNDGIRIRCLTAWRYPNKAFSV